MTMPTNTPRSITELADAAIAQAFREWAEPRKGSGPLEDDIIYGIESRADELQALAPPKKE